MATLFNPFFVPVDANGNPRGSAKLYFYETGTSTPANTWADSGLSVTNANPVVADSAGLFGPIYLDGSTTYKAILKDSADATIATRDPISSLTPTSISAALGYTPGNTAGSASSFLANDVTLTVTGTYYNGPNTGSIGSNGQTWALLAKGTAVDSGAAALFRFQIHDGTNIVATGAQSSGGSGFNASVTIAKVVSLSGPTTFTLKAADMTSSNGTLMSSDDSNATKFASSITAIRLA